MDDLEFYRRRHRIITLLEEKGYDFLDDGTSRNVYRSPNGKWVVKVPHDILDCSANVTEHRYYKARTLPVARCRLVYVTDIPIIFMEYVSHADDWTELRDLAWKPYDGGQCGYNRKGQVVLYDMGWDAGKAIDGVYHFPDLVPQ